MRPADNMVMISSLPSEFNIVTPRIHRDRLFVSSHHYGKSRPQCRDAPRCVRRLTYANYRMYMIRHDNKKRNFHILIMLMKSLHLFIRHLSDFRENHFTVYYFTEKMFFIPGTYRYKIIPSGIIVKNSSRRFSRGES